MNNYDSIIIGGGLGGLTAGAKLAKEGRKVLLIEQHYIPGGCATTFKRKDYIAEVGLHELDGLDKYDLKTKMLEDLKVFDNIEFIRLPQFFRCKSNNIDFVFPEGKEEAINALIKEFPKEEKAIKKYFKTMQDIRREVFRLPKTKLMQILLLPFFPVLFPYAVTLTGGIGFILALTNPLFWLFRFKFAFFKTRTIGEFLDKITKNEKLKKILSANIGYYSDDPYSLSLFYFSMAQDSYHEGGYFIKYGSQTLSDYLASIITKNGGEVLLSNKVTKILTKDNTAIGVEYQNTFSKNETNKAYANTIIANSAVANIIDMLPIKESNLLQAQTKDYKNSCSLMSIYLGFKKDLKEINNNYATFILDETKNFKNTYNSLYSDYESRPFTFVDYSQIDSCLTKKDKTFATICFVDKISDWDNLNEKEYKDKKEKVANIMLDRINKVIPGVKKELDFMEVATPKTVQRYTMNPDGIVYGYEQSNNQSGLHRFKNKSIIKNLYFASAWSFPGGGFTGALMSGWTTGQDILQTSKNNDLVQAPKQNTRNMKLLAKNIIAENTIELVFEKPKNFNFTAGQYGVLKIDNPKTKDIDIYHRMLSISSSPNEDKLCFAMRKSESGFKKSCDLLEIGDTANIFGPMGDFIIKEKIDKALVFLISGIGITPIISILKDLQEKNFEKEIFLFYSNQSKESNAYLKELESIKIGNFNLINIYTKQNKIRINENMLKEKLIDLKDYSYYLVGTSPFVKAMQDILSKNNILDVKADDFG